MDASTSSQDVSPAVMPTIPASSKHGLPVHLKLSTSIPSRRMRCNARSGKGAGRPLDAYGGSRVICTRRTHAVSGIIAYDQQRY
jgi:hypothetical protein